MGHRGRIAWLVVALPIAACAEPDLVVEDDDSAGSLAASPSDLSTATGLAPPTVTLVSRDGSLSGRILAALRAGDIELVLWPERTPLPNRFELTTNLLGPNRVFQYAISTTAPEVAHRWYALVIRRALRDLVGGRQGPDPVVTHFRPGSLPLLREVGVAWKGGGSSVFGDVSEALDDAHLQVQAFDARGPLPCSGPLERRESAATFYLRCTGNYVETKFSIAVVDKGEPAVPLSSLLKLDYDPTRASSCGPDCRSFRRGDVPAP